MRTTLKASTTMRLRAAGLALAVAGLASATAVPALAAPGDIRPLAGGYGGGQATGLGLVPGGVAVAPTGALIVSDQFNGMLREVELSTGQSKALAGIGAAQTGPLSGVPLLTALPGTGNSFVGPQQVAVAPDGDVLFAIGGTSTIRRLDRTTGALTVVAGDGTFSSAGADDGSPATEVSLGAPRGVAVDADGSVFISDTGANRIRRVDPTTGLIETVAGGGAGLGDGGPAGSSRVTSPYHLAFTPAGDLLVAENGGHRVRRITAGADGDVRADDVIETLAGTGTSGADGDGGPAAAARLNGPWGVAALANGAVVVTEAAGRRLRFIGPGASPTITTVPIGALDAPTGVATSGGRVYVGEAGTPSRRVQEVQVDPATGAVLAGTVTRTVAGNGTVGFSGYDTPALEAQFASPYGLTVAPDGAVVVADGSNLRVRRIDPATGRVRTVAGSGIVCSSATDATCVEDVDATRAKLARPWAVAAAADGTIYQLESNALISRISRVDPTTGVVRRVAGAAPGFAGTEGGQALDARFGEAQGLALGDDVLYVADTGNHRVRRIQLSTGTITTVAGTGTAGAAGDGGPAADAQLFSPVDVDVTADGDVLIADHGNRRVRLVDLPAGTISTVAGGGEGDTPALEQTFLSVRGVAAHTDGSIAIADTSGAAVYKTSPDRADISMVAGTGTPGFNGDHGAGDTIRLVNPYSVDFTAAGDLLVADTGNNRIRRVEGPRPDPRLTRVRPGALTRGAGPVDVTLEGVALDGATVDAGPGIEVDGVTAEADDRIVAVLRVAATAATGPRDVTVTRDGRTSSCTGCLRIDPDPGPDVVEVPGPVQTVQVPGPVQTVQVPGPAQTVQVPGPVQVVEVPRPAATAVPAPRPGLGRVSVATGGQTLTRGWTSRARTTGTVRRVRFRLDLTARDARRLGLGSGSAPRTIASAVARVRGGSAQAALRLPASLRARLAAVPAIARVTVVLTTVAEGPSGDARAQRTVRVPGRLVR